MLLFICSLKSLRGAHFFSREREGRCSEHPTHLTQAMIFSGCIVPKILERNFKNVKGHNDNFLPPAGDLFIIIFYILQW